MQNLRTYLDKLQKAAQIQLVRIKEPVDWRYEVTSKVMEMEKKTENPAILLENVKDYSTPLLINLFGNVSRIHLGLGSVYQISGNRLDFYNDWNRLFSRDVPPIHINEGPVKQVIQKYTDVDLTSLPIPRFYEQDGGRYVTAGLLTARNPEDPKEVNLSYVRMQVQGRDRFGVSLHSRGHMWHYYEKAKASGSPLEVAVIIGAHPALYLAAAAKITDEYSKAGALLGVPIELVKCETVDVPVPAQAEIILEGQMPLEEEDEGPFTEYTGYISGRSTHNLLKVTAITRRIDAIFQAIAPSNSAEHLLLSGLPKQARIYQAIKDFTNVPALNDIIWPVWATHFACFISLKEKMASTPGLAKQIALLLLGLDHYVKIVAILPAETDISDTNQVFGAITRRCDFKKGSDLEILSSVFSHLLDPSSETTGVSGKMILDATGPVILATGDKVEINELVKSLDLQDASFPCQNNNQFCVVSAASKKFKPRSLLEINMLNKCRLIACVDEDIDIHDVRHILWAMATRYQPDTGSILEGDRLIVDARKGPNWVAKKATLP